MENVIEDNVIDIADVRLLGVLHGPTVQPIPPGLLERLRQLRATQQALIEGCVAGLGIDLAGNNVDFNLDAGTLTTTPRA